MKITFLQFIAESELVTRSDLRQLEKTLDGIFKTIGVDVEFTKHFLDRVNDSRNGQQITINAMENIQGFDRANILCLYDPPLKFNYEYDRNREFWLAGAD